MPALSKPPGCHTQGNTHTQQDPWNHPEKRKEDSEIQKRDCDKETMFFEFDS